MSLKVLKSKGRNFRDYLGIFAKVLDLNLNFVFVFSLPSGFGLAFVLMHVLPAGICGYYHSLRILI